MKIGLGLGLSHIGRAATAPAGTVLAALLVNSQVFYDPTVAAPIPNIAPGLTTNSQTFFTASLDTTPGVSNVAPGLTTNSQTFFTATVAALAPGAVNIAPGLLTNSQTFYTATVAEAPPTPVLSLTTGGATPVFGLTATGLLAGDVVRLQYATDSGFTTGTGSATATLSSDEAAGIDPDIDFGVGTPQTSGTYYYKARIERGAAAGAYSNTVSQSLSVITASLLTNSQTFYTATVADGGGAAGHRYWRFAFLTGYNTGMTIDEAEFMIGGVDQTGSGTASASQEFDATFLAANAFDNLTGAGHQWASLYNNTWPVYLNYDFGSNKDITSASLQPEAGGVAPITLRIDYSDNNWSSFTTVYTSGTLTWATNPQIFTW